MELVKRTLRHLVPHETDQGIIYECRDCGTTVGPDTESCPMCESIEIVKYEISD